MRPRRTGEDEGVGGFAWSFRIMVIFESTLPRQFSPAGENFFCDFSIALINSVFLGLNLLDSRLPKTPNLAVLGNILRYLGVVLQNIDSSQLFRSLFVR